MSNTKTGLGQSDQKFILILIWTYSSTNIILTYFTNYLGLLYGQRLLWGARAATAADGAND